MLLNDIMKTRTIIIIITVLLIVGGCQTGREEDGGGEGTLNPVIQSLSPTARAMNLPLFTLTVHGENFREGAEIFFNDTRKTTERLSSNKLRCTVNSFDLSRATAAGPSHLSTASDNVLAGVQVYVVNYASGGRETGRSNLMDFSVLEHPRFNDPVNISQGYDMASYPVIAVDSAGVIHVAWDGLHEGRGKALYRRSTDSGETWDDAQIVSRGDLSVGGIELAAGGDGHVYVIYSGSGASGSLAVFFSRSPDYGLTWDDFPVLSTPGQAAYIPDIGANQYGEIAVAWHEHIRRNRSDVFLTHSGNHGASWSKKVNLSDNIGQSDSPVVEVDAEGNIYAAWKDFRPGNWDIFFRCSPNQGNSWDETINLSSDDIDSIRPAITCDYHNRPFVAWFDLGDFEREIYFTRAWEKGKRWSPVETVTNDGAVSIEPAVAVDEIGNVNIVWTDFGNEPGQRAIVFSRSTYAVDPWSTAVKVSRPTDGLYPDYASVAVDREGNIYVVWKQMVNGIDQIMFNSSR
jgi:hypothetical protein